MTGPPVLIDLGELPRVASFQPAAVPRRRPVRQSWPLVVATLLALVAGTVTAAGRAPELVPVATLAATGSNFAIYGDSLYVTPRGRGGGGGPLIAYRLADGVPRWTLPAEEGPFFGVQVVAGQPLAFSGSCPRLSGTELTAFDPATGRIRWRHAGQLLGRGAAGTVLVEVRATALQCSADAGRGEEPPTAPPAVSLQAVDLTTGETRWEIHPSPDTALCFLTVGGIPQELILVDQRGEAQAVDAVTGRVLASGHVPEVGDLGPGSDLVVQWHALVVGRLLLIGIRHGGELTMTAYSVDTFAPSWSRPVDLRLPSTGSYTPVWDLSCGGLVCLQLPNGIIAVDGATGEVRWRMANAGPIWSNDSVLLVGSDGRPAGLGPSVLRLVDPQTGATVIAAAGYDLHGVSAAGDGVFVLGAHEAGSTVFLLMDGGRGQRRFLGRVGGGYEHCDAGGRYLACTSGLDALRIWRMAG